ncbi:SdrD B-like domain-containing protein [Hydrogenophaga sp. SNF1]|uniref:SdrD B-like domain-containing protein n=1 Tax=Hydrogenophaga sp. SNF1 TaxID=3098762 RepID=UPI002ACC2668|nr:SdrD B-like domain-containing protein [Hydrogenophaga sp. SNF1]WQB83620.1 SdrD B-like domain-containing protein [Hydrogenophaga sp. SNF1]
MSTAAWGQAPAPEAAPGGGAQIQSLDRLQAEQERLRELARRQPPAYDDQFLSADDGPLLGGEANPTDAEPPGLRYWLVETQLNWTQRQPSGAAPQHLSESGLRLQYQQETLSHGQWQVSADARRHSGDTALGAWGAFNAAAQSTSGARLTLRNLGLPLSPSSFADIGLGDLHSEVTDGLTRGQRLSLGNSVLRGASLRVFTDSTDVRAGWGRRGQFEGGPYASVEPLGGALSWLGLTRRFEDQRYAAAQVSRSHERTALVYLRYEGQRGRGFSDTAGAAHGAGAGRIGGVVFLDANRDGVQQANEAGVPGVEVLLNNRERAVTDPRGRFEFAQVRTGSQRLSLRPESIPLPWGEGPQSRTVVDVPLRGEAIAPLGVVSPQ